MVSSPVNVTGALIAGTAVVEGVMVSAVGAPAGTVGPGGGGAVEPPEESASAASWALVPLNLFMSTLPEMPLTDPLLVRCQNVQDLHPPGTLGELTP